MASMSDKEQGSYTVNKFLQSAWYVPATVLGTEDRAGGNTKQKSLHLFLLSSFLHIIFAYLTLQVGVSHFVLAILVNNRISHFT